MIGGATSGILEVKTSSDGAALEVILGMEGALTAGFIPGLTPGASMAM